MKQQKKIIRIGELVFVRSVFVASLHMLIDRDYAFLIRKTAHNWNAQRNLRFHAVSLNLSFSFLFVVVVVVTRNLVDQFSW